MSEVDEFFPDIIVLNCSLSEYVLFKQLSIPSLEMKLEGRQAICRQQFHITKLVLLSVSCGSSVNKLSVK